jgi:hypothetical protein
MLNEQAESTLSKLPVEFSRHIIAKAEWVMSGGRTVEGLLLSLLQWHYRSRLEGIGAGIGRCERRTIPLLPWFCVFRVAAER